MFRAFSTVGVTFGMLLSLSACSSGGLPSPQPSVERPPLADEEPRPPLAKEGPFVVTNQNCYDDPATRDSEKWERPVRLSTGREVVFGFSEDGHVFMASDSDTTTMGEILTSLDGVKMADGTEQRIIALLDDGTVRSIENKRVPFTDEDKLAHVDEEDTAGPKCESVIPYDVGGWTDVTAIAADRYAVGIRKDGTALIAGMADNGACVLDGIAMPPDLGDWHGMRDIDTNGHLVAGLTDDGRVVAKLSRPGSSPQDLEFPLLKGADDIEVMNGHVVALMPDGTVRLSDVARPDTLNKQFAQLGWSGVTSIVTEDDSVIGITSEGRILMEQDVESELPSFRERMGAATNGFSFAPSALSSAIVVTSRNSLDVDGWSSIRDVAFVNYPRLPCHV